MVKVGDGMWLAVELEVLDLTDGGDDRLGGEDGGGRRAGQVGGEMVEKKGGCLLECRYA